MNRSEALAHFEQNYVQPKVIEKLVQAQQYLMQHWDDMVAEFRDSFREICRQICTMQAMEELGKVGFIQYSMLRSAILERRPVFRINAYTKEWYYDLDQKECQTEYQGGAISRFLDELEAELDIPRRKYLNQITPVDLEQVKLREAKHFNQLVVYLAEYALANCDPVKEWQDLAKEAEVEVRVGEYYDISEVVFKEDTKTKDAVAIKEWLEDHHENQYVAAVLKDLDLAGGDYRELDLRRVNFSGSDLSDSNLERSLLIKARLAGCRLSKCNFSEAAIYDADFSNTDLRGTSFFAAEGSKGIAPEQVARSIYSFAGVNFAHANLEAVDFRYANLSGANFVGANLAQTSFYGAELQNAIFSKAALEQAEFDETQLEAIIVIDDTQ